MNLKTLLKLLVALVVLGVVYGIVKLAGTGGGVTNVVSSDEKKKVFEDFPINDVSEIKLVEKENTMTIKRGEKSWEIVEKGNYPANAQKVRDLIISVYDLDIAQPMALQKNQFGRLHLLDPTADGTPADEAAKILTLSDGSGKSLGSLWLGKTAATSDGRPNPFGGGMMSNDVGRYVKRGDSNFVYVVGEVFNTLDGQPKDWLNQDFFAVEKIKSIARKTKTPEDDWSLSRDVITEDFILADTKSGEDFDVSKTTSMKTAFNSPRFDDIYTGDDAIQPDDSVYTITTFDGFNYEIATGEKNDLNELAFTIKVSAEFPEQREAAEDEAEEAKKLADEKFQKDLEKNKAKLAKEKGLEGRVFKVRSFVVDSIAKKRSELMKDEEKEGEGE